MRGIGRTLSRLNAARAMVAGAALLAGTAASTAHAQSAPETAMAVPRTAPPNGVEVALPQPLGPSQADLVRRIFALQDHGAIAAAERAEARLTDQTLLGSILADRYLGPYTVTSASQLEDWLSRFGDQAPAPAIYSLLARKLPRGARLPPAPDVSGLPAPRMTGPSPSLADPVGAETDGVSSFAVAVADRAASGETSSALAMIAGIRGLTVAHTGALKAIVARALFVANHDEQALSLASGAYRAAGGVDGASAYIAGLAAWRLGRTAAAGNFFREAATASDAEPPLIAAGAFWAARAALHLRQPRQWLPWMERAADESGTFYGLLAGRMLGLGPDLAGPGGGTATLGEADVDAVAATAAGWRAFALIEVGEPALAEAELATLWPEIEKDHPFGRAVMLVASRAGLPGLTARLSALISVGPGQDLAGLPAVPMPSLSPAGGFKIDPALVYALTRLESNFDASAVSRDGARGLMQLMPVAAAAAVGHWGSPLDDPGVNLELGQRYMTYLAGQPDANDDLLYVLGSYNGGPGAFAGWARTIEDGGDPLLFIESIPNGQTRHFVETVLAYTWIYAMHLGLPSPSLDALAQGDFPRFTAEANTGGMAEASLALH
ncbi:MAG TPA: lytic transglycosylase domain-containing protein [Acetobacteraceae bacterium]|jgi:soluble lytic murein transglycosylase|nr:lytic transglycosylase domain-containing protein [Acetobacteraceae bacterium]